MQFGNALPHLLHHIVLAADLAHGPVQLITVDITDGFYRIGVRPPDVLKLGMAFPMIEPDEPQQLLVVFLLFSPAVGWTNSPPIFCVAMETIADLDNSQRHFEMAQPTPTRPFG
jgi:hypothetical protein